MNLRAWFSSRGWIVIPLLAAGTLVWSSDVRIHRADYVTRLVDDGAASDARSPTGYAGGLRRLIVPGHNNDCYHWIVHTQLMLARGEWRVRHIDYANAPFGYDVIAASPYRWWLGLIAAVDHAVTGRPLGAAVERAALLADPLWQLLLLAGTTIFLAWRFGAWPAALFSAAVVTLYPLAGGFLPGVPDDLTLGEACVLWSVLLLFAARRGAGAGEPDSAPAASAPRGWYLAAGVVGGLGAWIALPTQVPVLVGIAMGAVAAAWLVRGDPVAVARGPDTRSWRLWALGGAGTCLAAYLIEFFPAHLASWQLRAVHPLYGLAWLGVGELVGGATNWIRSGWRAWNRRSVGSAALGLAALAPLGVAMWKTHSAGFLSADLYGSQLTKLPDGVVAANLWQWLLRDGFTPAAWATLLPLLLLLPVAWLLVRRETTPAARGALALALGPVLVAAGFAGSQLRWWNTVDGMLLVLVVVATVVIRDSMPARASRWVWSGVVAVVLGFGAVQLWTPLRTGRSITLTEQEVRELIERDLAHTLARRAGSPGAIVLAPFNETASLQFYGGLRGLATLDWENRDGLVAAIRIASASTTDEALELIQRRGVNLLILPSWNTQMDDFARAGLGQLENSFIDRLHQWAVPAWLTPVPYAPPNIPGLEGLSVTIFQVVEEQGDAVAASRTAEYFVEMGQLDAAKANAQNLRRYPADVSALVARLDVALATNDQPTFDATLPLLLPRLARGADRALPWDRRVCLAVVLARGKHVDLARAQVKRCVTEMDEGKLRALSAGSLYRLQVLMKAFDLPVTDPKLRKLSLDLLPPEWRSRL